MDVTYPVLVPNLKGLQTALEVGVDHVAIFTAASESFCQKNTNCTIKQSLQRFQDVFKVHLYIVLHFLNQKNITTPLDCGHIV